LNGVDIQTRRYRSHSQHSSTTPASKRIKIFAAILEDVFVSVKLRFKIKKTALSITLEWFRQEDIEVKAFDCTGFKNIGGCSVSAKLI
jgi:hypothetical protein